MSGSSGGIKICLVSGWDYFSDHVLDVKHLNINVPLVVWCIYIYIENLCTATTAISCGSGGGFGFISHKLFSSHR